MENSELEQLINALPLTARAKRFKQLADDMLALAGQTLDMNFRREYLAMAAQWRALEEETGRAILVTGSQVSVMDGEGPTEI